MFGHPRGGPGPFGTGPLGRVPLGPAPQATQVVDVIVNKDSSTYQHRAATLKLEKYNGTTPLETFLAKLDNCREYYGWSEKDTVHHLRACLEGSAGQVLVECAGQNSLDGIVDLLKTRFGCLNQTERFRTELRTRRRAHGETLQSVYTDIRQLVALSFPEQQGSVCEIVARVAFLAAINNPSIRRRVLERDTPPTTLDAALAAAVRLEALDALEATRHPTAHTFSIRAQVSVDERIQQLEEKFDTAMADMRRQVNDVIVCAEKWRQLALTCMSSQQGSAQGQAVNNQGSNNFSVPGGTARRGGGGGLRLLKGHGIGQHAAVNSDRQPVLSTARLGAGDSVPGVQSTQPALVKVRSVRACRSAVSQCGTEGRATGQTAGKRVDGAGGLPEIRSPVELVSTNAGGHRKRRKRGRRALPLASTDVAGQQLDGQWTAEY